MYKESFDMIWLWLNVLKRCLQVCLQSNKIEKNRIVDAFLNTNF